MEVEIWLNTCNLSPLQGLGKKNCMTPKISEENQLFHVPYLSNGLTTGNFKKVAEWKNWAKGWQNQIQPQGTWTFVSGLHKQIGSAILGVHFRTKVAVFWTCTSKMVTTSLNAYVIANTQEQRSWT